MDPKRLDDPQWLARNNILLRHSPRELGMELKAGGEVSKGPHLSVQALGSRRFPKNFPPTRIYELIAGRGATAEAIIWGPKACFC
jgi:hypothetical protein